MGRQQLENTKAESKCCCTKKRFSKKTSCTWTMPHEMKFSTSNINSLPTKKCPATAPKETSNTDLCGHYPYLEHMASLSPNSFLEVSSENREALENHAFIGSALANMPTSAKTEMAALIAPLESNLASERERVVESSPFARDHVEWHHACSPGERVHLVREGKKNKKCPAPNSNVVMSCPQSMDTYCYHKSAARCCCGSSLQVKGGMFKKKFGHGGCGGELGRAKAVRKQKADEAKRKAEEAKRAAEAAREGRKVNFTDGDSSAFYEACDPSKGRVHAVRPGQNKCEEARRSGTCPQRHQFHDVVNVVDFTMYCYKHDKAERCCCRERDLNITSLLFGGRKKVGSPVCAKDWPDFRKKPEIRAKPILDKKPGFFGSLFGKKKVKEEEVIAEFNDIFHDRDIRKNYKGKERKWDEKARKWARKYMKKIEDIVGKFQKEEKKGNFWTCTVAYKRV